MIDRMSSSEPSPAWSLHPWLEHDSCPVGNLPLSRVLVVKDANYPWLLLVPRHAGATEITDLDQRQRTRLMAEIARASEALRSVAPCDKLNVAAIGNIVPQLHVHIVARRASDPAWPGPVWGAVPARLYAAGEIEAFADAVGRALGIL
jgi:diadenosine tetraphosphate (Ap4A) HIT family hydrolase